MTTVADGGYRDRILANVGDKDPMACLESSRLRIRDLAAALGPAGLGKPWAPGKWTGGQILAHLADCEMAIGFRVRQIASEGGYKIQPFDEGKWARRYDNVDAELALQSFLACRAWNLALFRSYSAADLAREAFHPERGPETLGTVIRLLAGHDINHLQQLEKLR
jgi:hypothetical protein